MPGPLVSVVIPLYNTERYIGETLQSVLSQTFQDYEVVVIDDASRDRGPEIARGFSDPRIRIVTQENRGLAGARNSGIRLSTGTYIALLDADDRWRPGKLMMHVAMMEADPAIAISFSSSALIDEEGNDLNLTQTPSRATFEPHDIFCRNPVGNGSAAVLRRSALDAIAFDDERFGNRRCWFDESFRQSEDIECWTRLALAGAGRFGWIDEPLTEYRVNSGGLSANIQAQHATWQRFRAKVAQYAPAFEEQWGNLAEAYQLRYLARRAVRSNDPSTALKLMSRALRLAPRICTEEPLRTFSTIGAAAVRGMVPDAAFERVVRGATRTGARF